MRCLREILKTLWAMRKEGWVHRDISPANIMIPFKGATGPAGIIIDLDMSWKVSDEDASGKEVVGTICFMATDILGILAKPIHHVLHDMESVFWVAFIDGLTRSGTAGGVSWLDRLEQNSQDMDAVRTYKRDALQDVLIDDIKGFQDYFSEQYSGMRQLLRDWTHRLLRQDRSGILSLVYGRQMYSVHQIRYTDRHDPEKVFNDVDELFGNFIAMEERNYRK